MNGAMIVSRSAMHVGITSVGAISSKMFPYPMPIPLIVAPRARNTSVYNSGAMRGVTRASTAAVIPPRATPNNTTRLPYVSPSHPHTRLDRAAPIICAERNTPTMPAGTCNSCRA